VVRAAERLVDRIATLADEVEQLRAENAVLQKEMRDAIALFERAAEAGPGTIRNRARSANGRGRRRGGGAHGPRGRATPPEVTQEVVRAVLAKLGEATASQIAAEITSAGAPVNGRAVRFLAEAAGAKTYRGDDGQRRYRL
jgi:hypothetical protein